MGLENIAYGGVVLAGYMANDGKMWITYRLLDTVGKLKEVNFGEDMK